MNLYKRISNTKDSASATSSETLASDTENSEYSDVNERRSINSTFENKRSSKNTQASLLTDKEMAFRAKLQKRIIDEVDDIDSDTVKVASQVEQLSFDVINKDSEQFSGVDRSKVVQDIISNLTGYGVINQYLLNPKVSEIMINGYDMIYVEKGGKLILTDTQFRNNEQVMSLIEKIVSPLGRRIDESSPMVDARLPDGSRVNAIIPPLALNGPTVTIRKFPAEALTMTDLISFGTLSREMAIFLDACVKASLNIFISGGTSSGKTTLLNILGASIFNDERIVTIEDAAELRLPQEHVVSLESRPPNMEGKGAVTIRDLLINALRMRPDRIIVGEVRGGEALDMLQAMNTGHDGSMGTGHANSPRDMISRLETMVLLAGIELPIKAVRQQISGAIDLIIQQSKLKDGTRKITNITEVQGLEGDLVVLQDIFTFVQEGVDSNGRIKGELKATGIRPKFYEKLEASGIEIPAYIFGAVD